MSKNSACLKCTYGASANDLIVAVFSRLYLKYYMNQLDDNRHALKQPQYRLSDSTRRKLLLKNTNLRVAALWITLSVPSTSISSQDAFLGDIFLSSISSGPMISSYSPLIWKLVELDIICYMNIWGVAVLELDCHPDHNKEPEHAPCACP